MSLSAYGLLEKLMPGASRSLGWQAAASLYGGPDLARLLMGVIEALPLSPHLHNPTLPLLSAAFQTHSITQTPLKSRFCLLSIALMFKANIPSIFISVWKFS